MGRLNGSCLSSIHFNSIQSESNGAIAIAIDMLCKCSPKLKNVYFVDLIGNGCVTDAAVHSIVQHCPYIEKLSLKECHVITDLSLTYISQLSHLRELDLSGCKKLTSAAVQNLLIVNRQLETLMLSYSCLRGEETTAAVINEALLRCVGLHCPGLVKLHLRLTGVSSIPPVAFEAMITGLPALEELRLSDYNKLNSILSTLGMYCPVLSVYISRMSPVAMMTLLECVKDAPCSSH